MFALQVNTKPVPLSGNPGYVVGLPVRAGFRPQGYPFPVEFLFAALVLVRLHKHFLAWTSIKCICSLTKVKVCFFGYVSEVANDSVLTAISQDFLVR